jgi:hypothetical protein
VYEELVALTGIEPDSTGAWWLSNERVYLRPHFGQLFRRHTALGLGIPAAPVNALHLIARTAFGGVPPMKTSKGQQIIRLVLRLHAAVLVRLATRVPLPDAGGGVCANGGLVAYDGGIVGATGAFLPA